MSAARFPNAAEKFGNKISFCSVGGGKTAAPKSKTDDTRVRVMARASRADELMKRLANMLVRSKNK